MALAEGISRIKIGKNITAHVNAALYVISKFIPESKVKFIDSKECIILEIDGKSYYFSYIYIYFLLKELDSRINFKMNK